jgi:Lhr-like helicase
VDRGTAEHYDFLYRMTLDRKTIIFTNSREETEFVLSNLRNIAMKNKTPTFIGCITVIYPLSCVSRQRMK